MTGYEAFCLCNSIKRHFTSESYDYFKYSGKTSLSVDSFENRQDKVYFYKFSRRFSTNEQAVDFLVANFVRDPNIWIRSLLMDDADVEYRKRQKIIQSLTYTFTNEIASLMSHGSPNETLMVHDGEYPILLTKLLHGEVSLETVCIMNHLMNFLPKWDKKIVDNIHFPNVSRTIKKYTPFIKFEPTKYKLILKKEYDANTENIS